MFYCVYTQYIQYSMIYGCFAFSTTTTTATEHTIKYTQIYRQTPHSNENISMCSRHHPYKFRANEDIEKKEKKIIEIKCAVSG